VVLVYAADYVVRLARAPDKYRFFLHHIPELIAVIPFDRAFRLARLMRIERLLPFLRAYRLLMFSRRAWSGFLGLVTTNGFHHVIVFTVFLVLLASVGILHFEPRVSSFGDAVWWSIVTLSTVGYGDIAPTTLGGRLIGASLMIVGIGLLATLTGTVATYFLRRTMGDEFKPAEERTSREVLARAIRRKLEGVNEMSLENARELLELAGALERMVEKDVGKESDPSAKDGSG